MKKEGKVHYSVIIFILIIIVLLISIFRINSNVSDYKSEIVELNNELKEQRDIQKVVNLTKEFISKASDGQQKDYLTGNAKKSYEQSLANEGIEEHEHLERQSSLEEINLINVFANKEANAITSYAVYQAIYEMNPESDSNNSQRIVTFSMNSTWENTKDGYKVSDYKIDLLKDSLDDLLIEMSETND